MFRKIVAVVAFTVAGVGALAACGGPTPAAASYREPLPASGIIAPVPPTGCPAGYIDVLGFYCAPFHR